MTAAALWRTQWRAQSRHHILALVLGMAVPWTILTAVAPAAAPYLLFVEVAAVGVFIAGALAVRSASAVRRPRWRSAAPAPATIAAARLTPLWTVTVVAAVPVPLAAHRGGIGYAIHTTGAEPVDASPQHSRGQRGSGGRVSYVRAELRNIRRAAIVAPIAASPRVRARPRCGTARTASTVVVGVPGRLVGGMKEADHAAPVPRWHHPRSSRHVMTLSIAHVYPADDRVVLALRGTLDDRAASRLRAAITVETRRVPPPSCIVVDLSDVDEVDHAGVGCLVAGNRLCALAGVHLAVQGPSPLVRGLLRLRAPDWARTTPTSADDGWTARRCVVWRRAWGVRRSRSRIDGFGPPGRAGTGTRPRRGR